MVLGCSGVAQRRHGAAAACATPCTGGTPACGSRDTCTCDPAEHTREDRREAQVRVHRYYKIGIAAPWRHSAASNVCMMPIVRRLHFPGTAKVTKATPHHPDKGAAVARCCLHKGIVAEKNVVATQHCNTDGGAATSFKGGAANGIDLIQHDLPIQYPAKMCGCNGQHWRCGRVGAANSISGGWQPVFPHRPGSMTQ